MLFADDTSLSYSSRNLRNLQLIVNDDLNIYMNGLVVG